MKTPKCVWTETDGDDENNPPTGYLDGKRNGLWEFRYKNGNVLTCQDVIGTMQDSWEALLEHGAVLTCKSEPPVKRFAYGDLGTKSSTNNQKGGLLEVRWPDGSVEIGPIVANTQHGVWTRTFEDGKVITGHYSKGRRHETWTTRCKDGREEHAVYLADELQ